MIYIHINVGVSDPNISQQCMAQNYLHGTILLEDLHIKCQRIQKSPTIAIDLPLHCVYVSTEDGREHDR